MADYGLMEIPGGAVQTTITNSPSINAAATSFDLAASTGWPTGGANGEFMVIIDPGLPNEEKILCASRSGSTVTVATGGRGYDGTTASTHALGAGVYPVIGARHLREANRAVVKTVGQATSVGQILVCDAANSFAAVQAKTSGQILVGNGTTLASVAMSGDATIAASGAVTIPHILDSSAAHAASAISVSSTNLSGTGTDLQTVLEELEDQIDAAAGGSGPPTGAAGGVLDGTYPNPGLAAGVAGSGLAETSNVLSVNVGTGIEISSDAVRISAAAAGDGLTGGAGSALAVNTGSGLEISSDAVRIAAAAAGAGLTGGAGSALAVGAGTGIVVNANDVALDPAVIDYDAWATYTPTLTQSGTVTKTVTRAAYQRVGRKITVNVVLAVTGTGTANNAVVVGLPVAAVFGTSPCVIGSGQVVDFGAARYSVTVDIVSTTTVQFWATSDTTGGGAIGVVPNYAIASGDTITFTATYEAAS